MVTVAALLLPLEAAQMRKAACPGALGEEVGAVRVRLTDPLLVHVPPVFGPMVMLVLLFRDTVELASVRKAKPAGASRTTVPIPKTADAALEPFFSANAMSPSVAEAVLTAVVSVTLAFALVT